MASKYMKMEQVTQILFQETKRRGYDLEERPSLSTSSRYYLIRSGNYTVEFRVADHKGTTSLITLRLDHKLTQESIKGFIQNRLKALSMKTVMGVLSNEKRISR